MIIKKQNIATQLLALLIVVAFLAGLVDLRTKYGNVFELGSFSLASYFFVILVIQNVIKINKNKLLSVAFILLASLSFSLVTGTIANASLQIFVYTVFLVPILGYSLLDEKHRSFLIKVIILFSSIQIVFDLLFPYVELAELDRYAGSFKIANNKTRFLVFVIVYIIYNYASVAKRQKIFTLSSIYIPILLLISISALSGSSLFAIIIFSLSFVFSYFIKKGAHFIFANIVLIVLVVIYLDLDIGQNYFSFDQQLVWKYVVFYNRFLDLEHGVFAVYKHGLGLLTDNFIFGVGFGNYITRGAQFFGSEIAEQVPRTMIVMGTTVGQALTPYGISPFFTMLVEGGILVIPLIWYFCVWLWRYRAGNWYGYFSFYYLFYNINYNPIMFEYSEGLLWIVFYLLTNDLLRKYSSAKSMIHFTKSHQNLCREPESLRAWRSRLKHQKKSSML